MRADAQANREAIIETAFALFSDVGFDVSMRTIAARAGIGIGTLYRHFPTKDALIGGVASHLGEVVAGILEACDARWDEDPEAAWSTLVRDLAALRMGRFLPQAAGYIDLLSPDSWARRLREESLARLDLRLRRAKDAGLVREDVDPFLLQIGIAEISRPLTDLVDETAPGWQDWLVDVYLRGLRP